MPAAFDINADNLLVSHFLQTMVLIHGAEGAWSVAKAMFPVIVDESIETDWSVEEIMHRLFERSALHDLQSTILASFSSQLSGSDNDTDSTE